MIKTKKLPENVLEKIPILSAKLCEDKNIAAFYQFGSSLRGYLDPLSDLDLAVLLDKKIPADKFLPEYLKIVGIAADILKVDELDLLILNQAPLRIVHNILKTGRLLFCNDRVQLAGFIEINYKRYPDFIYYKNQYNNVFQRQIGILR
jgi:predicted nucleotidyltransferase